MSTMAKNLADFIKNGRAIICSAYNYKPIKKPPSEPVFFSKLPTSCLCAPCKATIVIPNGFICVPDVSLGIIIGEKASKVEECAAEKYIGGYCLALDITAKVPLDNYRKKGYPWLITKAFDTACPVSALIPVDKIENPNNVDLWCKVNGENVIKGTTKDMVFNVSELLTYLTKYITLYPNDLVLTGSPHPIQQTVQLCHEDIIQCGLGIKPCIMTMKIEVAEENQLIEADS